MKDEMKSYSARCGHVKRRLRVGDPLEGKVLEFALEQIEPAKDDLCKGIANKLKDGKQLSEYEYHVFVEVILLHAKLGHGYSEE